MAAAKKCDICGKLYELYNTDAWKNKPNTLRFCQEVDDNRTFCIKEYDVCPECMRAVKDFFKTRGRNAY